MMPCSKDLERRKEGDNHASPIFFFFTFVILMFGGVLLLLLNEGSDSSAFPASYFYAFRIYFSYQQLS
jgi:hypothetical protein